MCGNFGLLLVGTSTPSIDNAAIKIESDVENGIEISTHEDHNDLSDLILQESLHEVSRLHGLRVSTDAGDKLQLDNAVEKIKLRSKLLSPLLILESQTASTEIRGGQAGGYSCLEYEGHLKENMVISSKRVRLVARKRHPLAADLAVLYKKRGGKTPNSSALLSVIGHTRFATSSVNKVSELHPHEWVPFHTERVWSFNSSSGTFSASEQSVGLHITHNGDFDALEAYSQTMVVDEVGMWLERVLHTPNTCRGDSPKVAGCMDLFRVQGRWGPAARLAWVRSVLKTGTDVSGGSQLSSSASNTFPSPDYFDMWAEILDSEFQQHVNNIVKAHKVPLDCEGRATKVGAKEGQYQYRIDSSGERQLIKCLAASMSAVSPHIRSTERMDINEVNPSVLIPVPVRESRGADVTSSSHSAKGIKDPDSVRAQLRAKLRIGDWSDSQLLSFVSCAVRGFLRSDLYTAMVEFLSRAEGSFGLQVHSSCEPGVVVIASKGQPMSLAFNPSLPICLYGSEAEALAVPVDSAGNWLPRRIDLDSHGEVVRIGLQRALLEGRFSGASEPPSFSSSLHDLIPPNRSSHGTPTGNSHSHSYSTSSSPGGFSPLNAKTSQQGRKNGALFIIEEEVDLPPSDGTDPSSANAPMAHTRDAKIHMTDIVGASRILLECGLEIRSYSLSSSSECSTQQLKARCVPVLSAPLPYDPFKDLVAADLKVTPAVVEAIDRAWATPHSIERISAASLGACLVQCMRERLRCHEDSTDLLIGGIEASLWIAEQWAADLRTIFPQLNVVTVSANKLIGLGSNSASKAFFPGADSVLPRRLNKNTCILMISQSGQTFPTLHATRELCRVVGGRVWLMTGCFGSKMEQAMVESYRDSGVAYGRDRVFNNYSGNRPAEPSSVAVVATWHSLTRLLLQLVYIVRAACPGGRLLLPWESHTENATPTDALRSLSSSAHGDHTAQGSNTAVAVAVAVASRPRYVEKDSSDTEKEKEREREKEKEKEESAVVMLLSDGCIEDITSMLFTTVVHNLSMIVGHNIDGLPLAPPPSTRLSSFSFSSSFLSTVRAALGLMGCQATVQSKSHNESSVHSQLVQRGRAWGAHINETWTILVYVGAYIIFSVGFDITICSLLGDAVLAIVRSGGALLGKQSLAFLPRIPSIIRNQGIGFSLVGLVLQFADALVFVFLGKIITWTDRWWHGRPMWARMGKRTLVIVDTPCVHQLLETFVSKLYAQSYSFCSIDVHGASGMDHFVHRFTHRVVRGLLIAVGRPDGRLCCLSKSEAAVLLSAKQAAFIRNPDYPGETAGPEIVTLGHNPYEPNVGLSHHIVLTGDSSANVHVRGSGSRRKFVDEYLYERLFLAAKPFTAAILKALALSRRDRETDTGVVEGEVDESDMLAVGTDIMSVPTSSAVSLRGIYTHTKQSNLSHPFLTSNAAQGVQRGEEVRSMLDIDSIIPAISRSPRRGLGFSQHDFDLSHRGSLHSHGSMHGYTTHPRNAHTNMHTQRGNPRKIMTVLRDCSSHTAGSAIPQGEPLPYGTHNIDPMKAAAPEGQGLFAEFVLNSKGLLTAKTLLAAGDMDVKKGKSNDPAVRLAFSSKLDSETRAIQDRQVVVQQFYECRIASLERYVGFCVMFHAMAESSRSPWLHLPWNTARSQSNLRVATTASPISAGGDDHEGSSTAEVKSYARHLGAVLRGYRMHF